MSPMKEAGELARRRPAGTLREPSERRALLKFLRAVESREFSSIPPALEGHLTALFDEDGVGHQHLANTAFSLLKLSPRFNFLLQSADRMDEEAIEISLHDPDNMRALDAPLLHGLLRQTIVTDLPLERLVTHLRRIYLNRVMNGRGESWEQNASHAGLMVSLACQCFNNEYAYPIAAAESAAVAALSARLQALLASATPYAAAALTVYAMYAPLWTLGPAAAQLSAPLDELLLDRQVRDHLEEAAIRGQIPSFGISGDDPVTQAVQAQYEESPYPRWLDVRLPPPTTFPAAMAARFPFLGHVEAPSKANVLVVGCGTGADAIRVAARYLDAEVLAIDISRTSLAYAIRAARRYALSNLEFLHGDLQSITALGHKFDAIECIGVLNHLAAPEQGFRALADALRPGGYLHVGVYSRRLRQCLEPAKRIAARYGPDCSPEQLRSLRQDVIRQEREGGGALRFRDFFYLSGCRDLLCHTHEVQFTPAELGTILRNVNLSPLGYRTLDPEVRKAYIERFPQDPYIRDFDLVDAFEADHPTMFQGLQFFWARKGGDQ
jgi:SAM-dependent methyltransferase